MSQFVEKFLTNRGRWLSKNSQIKSDGKSVIYCMSRDQRVDFNHALLSAQNTALSLKLPLAVAFCLSKKPKGRAREHVRWMLDGLVQIEEQLTDLNVPFILMIGDHSDKFSRLLEVSDPAVVYVDFNPLKGALTWQEHLAEHYPVIQVDTHNVVPAWVASSKQEIGARTIRRKIHQSLDMFAKNSDNLVAHPYRWPGPYVIIDNLFSEIDHAISKYSTNGTSISFKPGPKAAISHLHNRVLPNLAEYAISRNDPSKHSLTDLSPYLHFGHLSSLQVLLAINEALASDSSLQASYEALVEEMVVRKELSDNFCLYNQNYKSLSGAPGWAQKTLETHLQDPRQYIYSFEDFATANTHDPAWNSAQKQLLKTGKMHGYMRIYWAKKILEWSESPKIALEFSIRINDFYSIDGGDPNGYVGILWSIAGLHDRPWGERSVYGTVRSMVYGGLRRKFDIGQYEQKWL